MPRNQLELNVHVPGFFLVAHIPDEYGEGRAIG
jgi:hypothetical protein